MDISFDETKRLTTLKERQLDFADAIHVFAGRSYTGPDLRFDYGEPRFITVGYLAERMVVIVWTPRNEKRRIISMRKANDREQAYYARHLQG